MFAPNFTLYFCFNKSAIYLASSSKSRLIPKKRKILMNNNNNNRQFSSEFSLRDNNKGVILWFRKGLRLHDNPSLCSLLVDCQNKMNNNNNNKSTNANIKYFLFPVFIIDPVFADPTKIGINRYRFLLESLQDLDTSFKSIISSTNNNNSNNNNICRLFVAKGNPMDVLPKLCKLWNVEQVNWEFDTEPYAKIRDEKMKETLAEMDVRVSTFVSHTLYDPKKLLEVNPPSSAPLPTTTYSTFVHMTERLGLPPAPANSKQEALDLIREVNEKNFGNNQSNVATTTLKSLLTTKVFDVPTLDEMGYNSADLPIVPSPFPGGETEALRRLHEKVSDPAQRAWVRSFSKPNTSPNSLEPSTTVLSPYMKFGCISARLFYHEILRVQRGNNGPPCTKPPVSLQGQLLWREFNYFSSYATPGFHSMTANPNCRKINWDNDPAKLEAWRSAKTGFPFIDALMTQLRDVGWVHHLGRHALACFLTRGDLWQHWEEGAKVFDLYLLDYDYALNTSNWLWLSASCFFHQYWKVYSPISFGKKTDPNGDFIRKFIPQLRNFPAKYIYEPWTAPIEIQRKFGCVIGKDYPRPIVDHAVVSKENIKKMAEAYEANRKNNNNSNEAGARRNRQEDDDEEDDE